MKALPILLAALVSAACQEAAPPVSPAGRRVSLDRSDQPLGAATPRQIARFQAGDLLFELPFREADGLGPLYIRASCEACHQADGRGPGLVGKMAIVEADGITTAANQSALAFGPTERPYVGAGARRPLGPPAEAAGIRVRRSLRLPPAVFGRGYLDAVADAEIERVAALALGRGDGIRGRISRVRYESEPNPGTRAHRHLAGQAGLIGRFGLKARIATLDEFVADALQGDMGLTSPLRPAEPRNPDGLEDDAKPGVDITLDQVNEIADYLALLEIPPRRPASPGGLAAFERALCSVCHVPALATRADYPVAALAGRLAPVYTDLLLHDMGTALADGVADVGATSREWRTAPLIGLRFAAALMHDGRAHTVAEAVMAHQGPGSEANVSVANYLRLAPDARAQLITFVEGL